MNIALGALFFLLLAKELIGDSLGIYIGAALSGAVIGYLANKLTDWLIASLRECKMDFSNAQIRAFRYWIQGYQNFYEPIVEAYFRHAGYTVLAHPAKVGAADIQRIVDALFDGHKRLGAELDSHALQAFLKRRCASSPTSSWSAAAGATWPS